MSGLIDTEKESTERERAVLDQGPTVDPGPGLNEAPEKPNSEIAELIKVTQSGFEKMLELMKEEQAKREVAEDQGGKGLKLPGVVEKVLGKRIKTESRP